MSASSRAARSRRACGRCGSGDRLRLGRPKGLFSARGTEDRRPLYVATGTGIAPLLSMLETRLAEQADGPVERRPVVVHGAAFEDDLVVRERLLSLAARGRIDYVPAVSRPSDPANLGWRGAVGRMDALLPLVLGDRRIVPWSTAAFVCGNPAMIEGAARVLRHAGMPADAIRTEAY